MRLSDIALAAAGIFAKNSDELGLPQAYEVTDVGNMFLLALDETPADKLASGEFEYPEVFLKSYSVFLKSVSTFPKPHEIDYKGDLLSPLTLIESILRHEVIAPLIRARIESKHAVFYSVYDYMKSFSQFPRIPLIEHDGGMEFAPYMSGIAEDAWSKYVFLTRSVTDLVRGSQVLTCPRADRTIGAVSEINFCFEGKCHQHMERGACDGWYPGKPRRLPNCLFAQTIATIGGNTAN
jgi:hypothetical protein